VASGVAIPVDKRYVVEVLRMDMPCFQESESDEQGGTDFLEVFMVFWGGRGSDPLGSKPILHRILLAKVLL